MRLLIALFATVIASSSAIAAPSSLSRPLPMAASGFQANLGQFDAQVRYWAQTKDIDLFITADAELVHRVHGNAGRDWVLVERYAGAMAPQFTAAAPDAAGITWVGIDGSRQGHDTTRHQRVELGQLWPGIRADVQIAKGSFEKRFHLDAGVDVDAIRIALDGVRGLRIAKDGRLLLKTGLGTMALDRPIAWQDIGSQRRDVAVRYVVDGDDRYGFVLGAHDRQHPLSIDPVLRSTFVGGNADEDFADMVVADDSVYVAGYTRSANFPGTTGGYQPSILRSNSLGGNIYLARYSLDLGTLMQATYFGSFGPIDGGGQSGGLTPRGLAVSADAVYLVGQTFSAGNLLPVTANGAQPAGSGVTDGFAVRFNRALTGVSQATYFGGSGDEAIWSAAIASDGLYVVGATSSLNLPGAGGGAITGLVSGGDAFVAKLALDLRSVVNSSYVTGTGTGAGNEARAVAVAGDDVYVAGSTGGGLIATAGAFQPARGSINFGTDGFVVRFSANLATLQRSSYLGGNQNDSVRRLAIDAGNVYLGGDTSSTNFPIAANAADAQFSQGEGFVVALSRDLSTRNGGTFIGGGASDNLAGLVLADGAVHVAGTTASNDFPGTVNGAEASNANSQIVGFAARLNSGLSSILQSTYYGTIGGVKQVFALSAGTDSIYVAGRVPSGNLPATTGAAQPASGGAVDSFVGRISLDLGAPMPTANLDISKTGSFDVLANEYLTYRVVLRNLGPDTAVNARIEDLLPAELDDTRWTCVAAGGAACTSASGNGALDQLVSLPLNATLTFDFCGRHIGLGSTVTNTATVTSAANMLDPVNANNSASVSLIDPSLFKDGFEDTSIPALCQTLPPASN